MAKVDMQKWGMFGAIIGLVTPFLLNLLSNISIPGITITQAAIKIEFETPNTGLAAWLLDIVGVSLSSIPLSTYLIAALGGAIFAIVGAGVANMFGLLDSKKPVRIAWVLVFGTLLAAWIPGLFAGEGIGIPSITALIALGISSAVLGWAYYQLFKLVGQSERIP